MALNRLKGIFRSPTGGLIFGLAFGLILASIASAGLNSLNMSRLMLVAAFVASGIYISISESTSGFTKREKRLSIFAVALLLVGVERFEAAFQPKPKFGHMPPLSLLLGPIAPGYLHPLTDVPGLPLAISYIDRPRGGFAGFGQSENDDAMLGIFISEIKNTSDQPLALAWEMTVQGEGRTLRLLGLGQGRWERQLNVNDWGAKHGGKLPWFLAPKVLLPHQSVTLRSFAFVAPDIDPESRMLIFRNGLQSEYRFTLHFLDLVRGTRASVDLPFGRQKIPNPDPVSTMLRERIEGNSGVK